MHCSLVSPRGRCISSRPQFGFVCFIRARSACETDCARLRFRDRLTRKKAHRIVEMRALVQRRAQPGGAVSPSVPSSATTRRTSLGRNGFSITGRPLSETNSRSAEASVSPVTKTTRPALSGPALLDLLVERAPVEIGHADVGEDHVVVLRRHPLQRFAPGADGRPRDAARRSGSRPAFRESPPRRRR